MRPPNQPLFSRSSFLVRYGAAALVIVAAALVCKALDPLVADESPFLLFTPTVMFAAWFGGLGPGLFATVLGAMIGDFFWVEPLYTLKVTHPHELFHTLVFYAAGIFISLMSRSIERARAHAVAANQAKDHFLAILSHELRNPLAPVIAAVCALEEDADLSDQARHDLTVIRRNVNLQARLIDDLLDANRLSRGKVSLHWETCDAHQVLRHALQVCEPEAQARNLTLRSDPAAARHHVRADPARLQQVFWNLLRNAIKFTPPGGSVTVRTLDTPATLVVQVQDTGQGIAPEDLKRIFEPFEQGSGKAPRQAGGLGLGLALSKALVELHGGAIRATSPGPGQGSTFTVELPTVPAPAVPAPLTTAPDGEPASPQAQPSNGHASTQILLVEDDPDTGPLLRRLLQHYGYDVTLADGLRPALREARTRRFDVLISDLQLPDGSGIDLLRALRTRQPLRGICVSGSGTDADLQETRTAGFEHHLVKPVDVRTLREAIEQTTAST